MKNKKAKETTNTVKRLTDKQLRSELEEKGYNFDRGKNTDWGGLYEMAINEGYEYIEDGEYWLNKN